MKKGFSIFLSILMLAAMLHVSVAMHYCSGKEYSTKLSLTGKLAHCNMEDSANEIPLQGTNLTKHCCDDVVTFFGIYSNYTPSFSFVPETFQNNFQVFAIPVALSVNSYTGLIPLYTNVSPPDKLLSTSVDLSDICVFRI